MYLFLLGHLGEKYCLGVGQTIAHLGRSYGYSSKKLVELLVVIVVYGEVA